MSLVAALGDYTVQNVAVGAVLLGAVSGLLGSFAVLRQQSLLGDTLAHAALPGVCIGFLIAGGRHLGWVMAGALTTGVIAALLVLLITRRSRLRTDAALGIVLSVTFALGVVLLTHIQGSANASQGGLDTFLFGQAAATLRADLWFMAAIALVSGLLVLGCWKAFKVVTFDPLFAGSIGLPVVWIEALLTVMIALAVVVGLQMVGVILMTAMVIAPAAAARQWVRRLEHMVPLAMAFGIVAGLSGALLSATGRNLATGPLIVVAATALVLVSIALAPGRGLLWAGLRRWRDRRGLDRRRLLGVLEGLAAEHGDPAYAAERGMLNSLFGHGAGPVLRQLEREGFVRRVRHMAGAGPHWVLTEAGRSAAARQRAGAEEGA